jgi:hypothetical protein
VDLYLGLRVLGVAALMVAGALVEALPGDDGAEFVRAACGAAGIGRIALRLIRAMRCAFTAGLDGIVEYGSRVKQFSSD